MDMVTNNFPVSVDKDFSVRLYALWVLSLSKDERIAFEQGG
ncbi:MAG: hypothetical protein PHH11_13175 [Methylomonas sp.]|nr:hypothetical protein [Methylomonas sp.]